MSMWNCKSCEHISHDEDCDEGERCPICWCGDMEHVAPFPDDALDNVTAWLDRQERKHRRNYFD